MIDGNAIERSMPRRRAPVWPSLYVGLVLALGVTAPAAVRADATPMTEEQKIEYLIGSVARLMDAKFVRNGAIHDARDAADHLRLKLRNAGSRVKTAEDFIRLCGTGSSVSGQPYQIRFDDGTVVASAVFLRAKLAELDKPAQPRSKSGG